MNSNLNTELICLDHMIYIFLRENIIQKIFNFLLIKTHSKIKNYKRHMLQNKSE